MPHVSRSTVKAKLVAGRRSAPVLVSYREVIDLRDHRGHWEGTVWSDRLPAGFPLDGSMRLVLPDGRTEAIRLIGFEVVAPVKRQRWARFRGSFLSERNIRD